MKRVTLILSLLLFCGSLVMGSNFADSGPPGDVISIDYELPQTLNVLEVQDLAINQIERGDATIFNSTLTNWPENENVITRKERGITIRTLIDEIIGINLDNQIVTTSLTITRQCIIPVCKFGVVGREVGYMPGSKFV